MTHVHPLKVSWGDCDPANIVYAGRLTGLALECHVWPVKLGTTSIAFRVDAADTGGQQAG